MLSGDLDNAFVRPNVLTSLVLFSYFKCVPVIQELRGRFLPTASSLSQILIGVQVVLFENATFHRGLRSGYWLQVLILHTSQVSPLKLPPVCGAKRKWLLWRSCLTLNTISLFWGTITKVRLANSFNSYWLPRWRAPWLDALPSFTVAVPDFLFQSSFNCNISPSQIASRCAAAGKLVHDKVNSAILKACLIATY